MILAIDFDEVIHDTKNPITGRKMGAPIYGSQEALDDLHDAGHKIIIHTVRGISKAVMDWLEYYDIPYDEITNIKPKADWYIDDKSLHFESWEQVMNKLGINDD